MDLFDVVRILWKRWMITLALSLLTLGGVAAGYLLLPPSYESKASVVLLSSAVGSKAVGGNPYLAFDSSLSVTADVVARRMMDDAMVSDLRARGKGATYKIGIAADTNGPILEIDVTGSRRAEVQATLDAVVDGVPATLNALQANAGQNARIRVNDVSKMRTPRASSKSKLRLLSFVLACGFIVTVGIPLFAESRLSRRRAAHATRSRPPADGPSSSGPSGVHVPSGPSSAPKPSIVDAEFVVDVPARQGTAPNAGI